MRDVYQNNREARIFVEARLPIKIAEPFVGLMLTKSAKPIGAVILNHYDHWNVEFTCVLTEADVGTRIARRVAYYVFEVMKCHRCTATTARSNIRAKIALKKLGFRFEGVVRQRFTADEDALTYGLLRSEQRIIRLRDS